jgi:hypothetical protein
MAQFKYFGTTVTNQNLIQEEIKTDWILVMLGTIQFRMFLLLFTCGSILVWNLVSDTKEGTQTEGVPFTRNNENGQVKDD